MKNGEKKLVNCNLPCNDISICLYRYKYYTYYTSPSSGSMVIFFYHSGVPSAVI